MEEGTLAATQRMSNRVKQGRVKRWVEVIVVGFDLDFAFSAAANPPKKGASKEALERQQPCRL